MGRRSDPRVVDGTREEFERALAKGDLEVQYEALSRGVADAETAGALLGAIDRNLGDAATPRPILWEVLRNKVTRVTVVRRIVGFLTGRDLVSDRAWGATLTVLVVVSAVATASLVWAGLTLSPEHAVFRVSVLSALFFFGVMLLSAVALMTQPQRPSREDASPVPAGDLASGLAVGGMVVPALAGALRTVAVAAAAVAALWAGVALVGVSDPSGQMTLATVSPTQPLIITWPGRRPSTLRVTASDTSAQLHLRLLDENGRTIGEEIAIAELQVNLRRALRPVRAEVTAAGSTRVTVSTRGDP
jgi:hypothetical protein